MYGDKKAANKMKTKSSLSSSDSLHRRGNVVAAVSNEDANGNDKHTKRPSIAKRNTSLHEAPRIGPADRQRAKTATIAPKRITVSN